MRAIAAGMLVVVGCATSRTYKTDRFDVKIGDGTRVEEQAASGRTDWKFFDASGRQFLGATVYAVAGDPTFPCGMPEIDVNGTKAFFVRRTNYLRPETIIASLIFPQDEGRVLEFSYLEKDERARALVTTVKVATRDERRAPCEVVRSGGPLEADRYDAGLFNVKLVPGAWLLDSRHFFGSQNRESPTGGWYFEDGSTGEIFLSVQSYPPDPHHPPRCDAPSLVAFNGTCTRRCRDTDGLEPYPGPSNVLLYVEASAKGHEYVLEIGYDEHSATAGLALATLGSMVIREPGRAACAREPNH